MTKREDQARDYAAEQWRYVKVYGASGDSLRLTDAERRAIQEAADAYEQNNGDPDCERIADTLRGLLERMK